MYDGDNGMLTIGHRGLRDEFPENTALAVREAAPFVDLVEIDVRPCATGELVVAHDDELEGTTGREGLVSETDLAALQNVTIEGADESISPFEELLANWPENTGINVDIKGSTSIETVLEVLATTEVDGPIVISAPESTLESFDPRTTDEMVGLSFWRDPAENVEYAATAGCEYVHIHHRLCLETDVVERAHDAGLSVDAWSIDDPAMAAKLDAIGVDAITVNRRDAIR